MRFVQAVFRDEDIGTRIESYVISETSDVVLRRYMAAIEQKAAPNVEEADLFAADLIASFMPSSHIDMKAYGRQISRLLQTFPAFVVRDAVDPGCPDALILKSKFLPSLHEIAEWCRARVAFYDDLAKRAKSMIRDASALERAKTDAELLRIEDVTKGENIPLLTKG